MAFDCDLSRPEEMVMFSCVCRSVPRSSGSTIDAVAEAALTLPASDPGVEPAGGAIVGVVVFLTHRKEQAEAILDGEGRWSCPGLPVLDRVLNILYEPGRVPSGNRPFGHAELIRVAEWLKGEVRIHRP